MEPQAGDTDLASLTDGQLVLRAREGDGAAFAAAVERHYHVVLVTAERVLGDRDDALEVAQDALVRAFERIGDLTDPDRLRAWLLAITRNRALAVMRRRRHVTVDFHCGQGTTIAGSLVADLRPAAPAAATVAELADLRRHLAEKIRSLTGMYAEIVRMFYLDGLSLPEIARRLDIPLGTAKSRLAQARALLRKELMMDETSGQMRNQATANPILEIDTVHGSGSPRKVMEPLLAQQILVCVRKELKEPPEIAAEVKADVAYVQDHLALMTAAEVLAEEAGRYRANCILFGPDDMAVLTDKLGSRGRQTAEVIAEHLDALSAVITELGPTAQGFDEGYLRWIILPTFVLNFGVAVALAEGKGVEADPPARPDGGNWFYKPRVLELKISVELGCNYYGPSVGAVGCAQYWNRLASMRITRPGQVERVIIARLGAGAVAKDSLVDVFGTERVAGMVDAGLIRIDGGNVVAAFPVFSSADGDALDPVLTEIVDDVIGRVYAGYPDDVYAVLDSLGFSFIRSDYPTHAQELAQMGATRALIDAGILPPQPSPAPLGWGFFAWRGAFSPMVRRRG